MAMQWKKLYKQHKLAAKIWAPISFVVGAVEKIRDIVSVGKWVWSLPNIREVMVVGAVRALSTTGALLAAFVIADWHWQNIFTGSSRPKIWTWMGLPIFALFCFAMWKWDLVVGAFSVFGVLCLLSFVAVGVAKLSGKLSDIDD